MKAYVAVTDNDWFRFLRNQSPVDEVNFWQPSGGSVFKRLDVGEPFLFKLHHPENYIVGGGFFTHRSNLPLSVAWDTFKEKNGAPSLNEMRHLIERRRRTSPDPHEDYKIGCIILRDPFFFEERDWIQVPKDFYMNIVQGKTYDLRSSTGRLLWEVVKLRLQLTNLSLVAEPEAVYGDPVLARHRLGQGTFRVLITDTYSRKCAVTREKALPVLEAAHIRPLSEGGSHRVDNGLLLRSDVHVLFDQGYVTVTPDYRLRVSRRLKDDFDNGKYYYQFHGSELWVPRREEDRPGREFLEWHGDTLFRR